MPGGSADRPNVFIDVKKVKNNQDGLERVCVQLLRHHMDHHFRIGYFGASRYPKVLIMLQTQQDCDRYLAAARHFAGKTFEKKEREEWIASINQSTAPDRRARILEDWSKVDASVRILIASPMDDLDLIVPDLETLVVVAIYGPEEMGPRWQRMARMAGQKGHYLQIVRKDEWVRLYGVEEWVEPGQEH